MCQGGTLRFERGDKNVSSAMPREINDHHSEIYSLLGQCVQPWSSQKGKKGEDGMREGEDGMREGKERKEVVCWEINRTRLFYRIFPSSF